MPSSARSWRSMELKALSYIGVLMVFGQIAMPERIRPDAARCQQLVAQLSNLFCVQTVR